MDKAKYEEIVSKLDAREVLRYLNYLGIRNISGEVLKYFITDLKKLIKYDLLQENAASNTECTDFEIEWSERLYSASTVSSRLHSQAHAIVPVCNRDCRRFMQPLRLRNINSAPNLYQKNVEEKMPKRACSCVRVGKKREATKENRIPQTASTNIIKVPKTQIQKKSDPVSLYHYYNSLWEKYKPNVPGENNWSDLRWSIRQKMAGVQERQITVMKQFKTSGKEDSQKKQ